MRIEEGRVNLTTFEDGLGNKLQVDKHGSFIIVSIGNKFFNFDPEIMSEFVMIAKKAFKTM